MLFVIAIEVLAQKIGHSKMIKGIEIEYKGSQEINLSQYTDDTTELLSDSESVMQLFELLGLFERCSGLKINEWKSELSWLGSWRHRKDKNLNLQISEEPVYGLGVHFAYERDTVLQRNFWDKFISLKKLLNIRSQTDISVYGKIDLVKSLALSKLVFISSVMETPKLLVEVNKILIEEMTCKKIYTKLLSLRSKPPPTCEERLLNFGHQKDDLRKLYLLPFEVTKEVKLSMLQYKIIHNILRTKSLSFKMKKEDSPHCPFCPADHTIVHLFTECA